MTVVNTKGVKNSVTYKLTGNGLVPTSSVVMSGPDVKGLRTLGGRFPSVTVAHGGTRTTANTSVIVLTIGP